MNQQFGSTTATTVEIGKRVGARLVSGAFVLVIYIVYFIGISSAIRNNSVDAIAGATTLAAILVIVVALAQVYLNFASSTSLGGKFVKIHFIKADTGAPAKGTVFLKYLAQGFLESVTFGVLIISYLVSHRNGQHWLDRAFNVVAVSTPSVAQSTPVTAPQLQRSTAPGPTVMPVRMPQQRPMGGVPASSGTTTDRPLNPPPHPMANRGGPSAGAPLTSAPSAANPWALPPQAPASAPVAARPLAPVAEAPSAVPSSPPVTAFTPPGQPPISRNVSTPTVPRPAAPLPPASRSASLLDDETVIDPEVLDQSSTIIAIDDGQRLELSGPVVLGRNPSAPSQYPAARIVQVVDESMRLSKTHVVIMPTPDGIGVYDVGATNGVHLEVDGQKSRVTAKEVHLIPEGAVVHFGGRKLRVEK